MNHRPTPHRNRTALVLRHDPAIALGNLEPVLRAHNYEIVNIDTPITDVTALDALAYDLIIVLGGDQSAYEDDRYPYLAAEIELLRKRIAAKAPVLGICLGAQLLAKALGARVFRGDQIEVGWLEITSDGTPSPLHHFKNVPVMQWHGDTFELPDEVELLASSARYPNQAFRRGNWLLAVQFHPEATGELHELWLQKWADDLVDLGVNPEELRSQRESGVGARAEASAQAMLNDYLNQLPAAVG